MPDRRRPLDLALNASESHPHAFSLMLTRDDYEALTDFIAGFQRWTHRRLTKQDVIRTALRSYIRKHHAWLNTPPEHCAQERKSNDA